MFRLLERNPARVFALLAVYFILEIAVRLSLPHALELDESQQIFLAQWLAVGYDSQPPFYNWIQYLATGALGSSLFSLSIVKNSMLFSSYLFLGLAAWQVIGRKSLAMLVPLGLLTIPQVGFEAQRDLTHTVAVIFASCMFIFTIVRTVERPSLLAYAMTGLAIGIGMTAKYNFVLLPAATLLALLADADMRKRLFDWRLLITAAVALAVTLPHGLWFLDNLGAATGRTMGKLVSESDTPYLMRVGSGILTLLVSSVGFSVVTVAVFAVSFGKDWRRALRASNRWTRFCERMLLVVVLLLLLVILAGGVDSIRDRYLTPYLLILPLYLCLKLDAAGTDIRGGAQTFVQISVGIMVIIPAILILRIVTAGWSGEYSYLNTPMHAFAEAVRTDAGEPSVVVSHQLALAGNMRIQFPHTPAVMPSYTDFGPAIQPSTDRPVVIVWMQWRDSPLASFPEGVEAFVQEEYGPLRQAGMRTVALPRNYGRPGEEYEFGYAWYIPAAAPEGSSTP